MFRDRVGSVFKRRWLLPVLYALLIFFLSSLPGRIAAGPIFRFDLLIHFLEFGLLGFLLVRLFAGDESRVGPSAYLVAVLIGLAYGGLDELHQKFVPGRCMESSDFLADGLGVVIGVGLYVWLRKVKREN